MIIVKIGLLKMCIFLWTFFYLLGFGEGRSFNYILAAFEKEYLIEMVELNWDVVTMDLSQVHFTYIVSFVTSGDMSKNSIGTS